MHDEVKFEEVADKAVEAVVKALRDAQLVSTVYDTDRLDAGPNSISVVLTGWRDEQVNLGIASASMRYEFEFNIWYYHSEVTASVQAEEIWKKLWLIDTVLTEKMTLNGFANGGSQPRAARLGVRKRQNSDLMGGVINFVLVRRQMGVKRDKNGLIG